MGLSNAFGECAPDSIAVRITEFSPEGAELLVEGLLLLTLEVSRINNEATRWDYATAVDELLSAIGAPGEMLSDEFDRPDSDDDRPLSQRISDPTEGGVGARVASVVMGLSLVKVAISQQGNRELADDLKNVFLAFIAKLKGEQVSAPVNPAKVPAFKADDEQEDPAA